MLSDIKVLSFYIKVLSFGFQLVALSIYAKVTLLFYNIYLH